MNNLVVLWDFDGTIVDSTIKNMEVTIEVLRQLYAPNEMSMPRSLMSKDSYIQANHKYKNWRELYQYSYDIPAELIDEAGKLWSPLQAKNLMIPPLFNNLDYVFKSLHERGIRIGICSQNCSDNISNILDEFGLRKYFECIIGYDDVSLGNQKPNPEGFIKCISLLQGVENIKHIIYIGDHQEDINFARNAAVELAKQNKLINVSSIAVGYSGATPLEWNVKPDYIVNTPLEIIKIIDTIGIE